MSQRGSGGVKRITFAVTHVETLAEAKECLEKEKFSVLVLDLGLPDSQGIETFFEDEEFCPDVFHRRTLRSGR